MAALLGVGSSPFARGLHPTVVDMALGVRIIPARAGFTGRRRSRSCAVRDHPRSRGVYTIRRRRRWRAAGSSPLARGLRHAGLGRAYISRIIPARAGFTPTSSTGCRLSWDHPRSRGVYENLWRTDPSTFGSSPLARGLHLGEERLDVVGGVIPARAGFTSTGGASLSVVAIPAGLPPGVVGTGGGIVGALFFDQDSQGVHPRCPPRTSLPCPR